LRGQSFQVFVVLVALFAFGEDVLDEISDRAQRANWTQTSQSTGHHKDSSPKSGCPNHGEAAVLETVALAVAPIVQVFSFAAPDESIPPTEPAAIDHPPQLA
jgi:hypothetical protein